MPGVQAFEHGLDLVAIRAHAGEVRHRFDADVLLDAADQLDRLVARSATSSVGDRDKGGPQFSQALDGLVQVLFPCAVLVERTRTRTPVRSR